MAIKLIIIGLRRSGTTIFWQTLRQDQRLRCYDEPFNPQLDTLPEAQHIKSPEEFRELVQRDSGQFWDVFTPIQPSEELDEPFTDRQRAWLEYLATTGQRVALDTTRCHFKLEALRQIAPEATLVHLYRSPESVATSHMLPTVSKRLRGIRMARNKAVFWTRTTGFDSWSFESIIGRDPGSRFARHFAEIGLDPEDVYALPAVGRLLAYWRVCFEVAERDGLRFYGDRFISQSYESFCADPGAASGAIYRLLGLEPAQLDFSRIYAPKDPFQADSPRWEELRRRIALTSDTP